MTRAAAGARTARPVGVLVLAGVVALVAAGPLAAREGGSDSPRAAVQRLLGALRDGDYEAAAQGLDLRRVPEAERFARGPELARQLGIVLEQALRIDLARLSDVPEGALDDRLAPGLESLGTVDTAQGTVQILLERLPERGGGRAWRVSASTVAQLPGLYAEHARGPLLGWLPAPRWRLRVLDVELWQWVGLALLVLLAWAVSWLVVRLAVGLLRPVVHTRLGEGLLRIMVGPARLAVWVVAFRAGVLALALSAPALAALSMVVALLAVVTVAWGIVRVVDVLGELAGEALVTRAQRTAVAVLPAARRAVKALVAVLAAITAMQVLGFNVTGLLAGLGIGGLALALAAQKTVENLFGGVSLMVDQPVRVGDFCRFGDRVGTVEEVGLRSTRVRTLDRTVVAVPNAEFATMHLENFSRRDRIWLHATLGLRYETTPDQLRLVLVEIRRMLYAHARIHPEPARIRFVGFGDCSLDLEIFAYVRTTDYDDFLAVREDVYLRIMDIVETSGTGFALPAQRTYLARDTGPDVERRRAGEARVRAWRDEGSLPLPDFPPDMVARLAGTVGYPPPGAAGRAERGAPAAP